MPNHPFLTDQSPFLNRRFSSQSWRSDSSMSSNGTKRSSTSSAHSGPARRPQVPLDASWSSSLRDQPFTPPSPSGSSWPGSYNSNRFFPTSPGRPSRLSSRPLPSRDGSGMSPESYPSSSSSSTAPSGSYLSTTPSSAPSTSPLEASPTSTIDRHCLAWMREAEQQEMFFGSVGNRMLAQTRSRTDEPRLDSGVITRAERVVVLDEEPEPDTQIRRASKVKSRLQRF